MSCDHKNVNGGVGCIIANNPVVSWCDKCGAYKFPGIDWQLVRDAAPFIDMLLHCPLCHARHIDTGEFETKPHHTHACQSCGHCWRPAVVFTRGVQFLPGFKNIISKQFENDIIAALPSWKPHPSNPEVCINCGYHRDEHSPDKDRICKHPLLSGE